MSHVTDPRQTLTAQGKQVQNVSKVASKLLRLRTELRLQPRSHSATTHPSLKALSEGQFSDLVLDHTSLMCLSFLFLLLL